MKARSIQQARRAAFVVMAAALLPVALWLARAFGGPPPLWPAPLDPARLVGVNACGECHEAEVNAWRESAHAKSFLEMHRTDEARQIAKKLGITRIKTAPQCMGCHYTPKEMATGRLRPEQGVSCESCHGEAKDWLAPHSDYGGKDVTGEAESEAHRRARLEQSLAGGMRLRGRLYELARACYRCHGVPDEGLVARGGHLPGQGFELLAASQGEVRHNFQGSAGKENAEPAQAHKRMLYLAGQLLSVEFALRGAALATQKGPFLQAGRVRMEKAAGALAQAAAALKESAPATHAALLEALAIARGEKLDFGRRQALEKAADRVAALHGRLLAEEDGAALAALDSLLPGRDQYRGKPQP